MSDVAETVAGTALDPDEVVTVAELNADVAATIDDRVDLHEYVVGDVSDRSEASGNLHFDLVDDDAAIHCVLMGYNRGAVATEPDEEMQVALSGSLTYYEQQGSCTIFVDEVVAIGDSRYGEIYAANRRALAEDGLLTEERKQPLPDLPRTVGLVTSRDSDARRDAVRAIHDRHPRVDVELAHTPVQGKEALTGLLGAITTLDEDAGVDVIVVTRGGGADRTLRVFDERPLCRVIANTETPVVVGVGHDDDRTLAEEVADERVMTPTDVGVVVPEREALAEQASDLSTRLDRAYGRAITTGLAGLESTLTGAYESLVDDSVTTLQQDLERASSTTMVARVRSLDAALTHASERVRVARVRGLERELDHARERRIERRLTALDDRLEAAYRTCERERTHEADLEDAVADATDAARADLEAELAATRRRYRAIVAGLVALLLGSLVVIALLALS